jgi:Family of unknown function (DUF6152)
MRTKLLVPVIGVGLLLAAVPLWAHHAFAAEFDINRPIILRGTVTKWLVTNPHSWIHIDVKAPDGTVVPWAIEGGSPNSLYRLGFTKESLVPGTEIVVDGFQAKDLSNKAVGKNITLPSGKKLFLGGSAPGANGDGAEEQKR